MLLILFPLIIDALPNSLLTCFSPFLIQSFFFAQEYFLLDSTVFLLQIFFDFECPLPVKQFSSLPIIFFLMNNITRSNYVSCIHNMQYTNPELLKALLLKTLSIVNVIINFLRTLILNHVAINNVGNEKCVIEEN